MNIRYFGMIAEATGKNQEKWPLKDAGHDVKRLNEEIRRKYPQLAELSYQIAVNQRIQMDGTLDANDEIAILPPFSGG
jgi:molybdopterin converting factor small subunit